jgi:hypothetical protein
MAVLAGQAAVVVALTLALVLAVLAILQHKRQVKEVMVEQILLLIVALAVADLLRLAQTLLVQAVVMAAMELLPLFPEHRRHTQAAAAVAGITYRRLGLLVQVELEEAVLVVITMEQTVLLELLILVAAEVVGQAQTVTVLLAAQA